MSSYPVTIPLAGRVGGTIDLVLNWKEGGVAVPLAGWTALIQVRADADSPVLAELASADGEITLGGSPHNIVAQFTEDHTKAIGAGKFRYDIRMTGPAGIIYPVEGPFVLKTPISRPA